MNAFAKMAIALFIVAPFLVGPSHLIAQDAPAVSVVAGAEISVEDLTSLLRPLPKEKLVNEAKAWQGLLEAKASEIAAAEIASRRTEGAAGAAVTDQLAQLGLERDQLIERLTVVLGALKEKQGLEEVKPFENYISTVSASIDVKQPSVVLDWFLGWVQSPDGAIKWAINIGVFIIIFLVFKIIASIVAGMTRRALSSSRINLSDLLRDFVVNTLRKVIVLVGLVIALSQLGVNVGPLLAGIGVVGFVIGFALQDTLSNFASGFMILLYRPYDIGDVINAAGQVGKVDSMSLVSTTLKTPDNQTVVVPNGAIWGGVITNVTGNDTRRVDLTFGIGYGDDIDKAQAILEDVITNHPLVLKDPEPVIKLHELADSAVNFVCRPWSKTSDYWAVYWDITRSVKKRFDEENISIPFPQQDIHIHQAA